MIGTQLIIVDIFFDLMTLIRNNIVISFYVRFLFASYVLHLSGMKSRWWGSHDISLSQARLLKNSALSAVCHKPAS